MSADLIHPGREPVILSVAPEARGWEYLGFAVHRLGAGQEMVIETTGVESALVPMVGRATVEVGAQRYELGRHGVFDASPSLLYLPPGVDARLSTDLGIEMAIGSAPASGEYPTRLIRDDQIQLEVRGGGSAQRQVNHLLAPPLQAERLIVYEVYLPAGSWAGWPPHRHDGVSGSPYLEETYFFRFERPDGFGIHRNYDMDGFDEIFTVHHDDCVAVPRGFHVTGTTPGNNMWILNFLAGELVGDDRATPPYFDPTTTWIRADWSKGRLELPVNAPTIRGER